MGTSAGAARDGNGRAGDSPGELERDRSSGRGWPRLCLRVQHVVGFVFWYRGLILGGIAGVGQLQLLQPFFGLALAELLLHEPVAWTMIAMTGLVVLCVAGAKRFA
jgi:hypothetical protein